MKYRRETDGLRALAVVSVILFHARVPYLAGGFLGVDIFFVISGFLITSLLDDDLANGRYSLAKFYERRVRRIFPALSLVLFVTVPAAFVLLLPSPMENFSASLAAVVVFLSNFYFLSQVGYFAPDAELEPLLHTWSLAVEEQFYLLFPPLLALLRRKGSVTTYAVLSLLAAASFCFSLWGAVENPGRNFYFTGSRAWELLAGSIAALVFRSDVIRGNDTLAILGLVSVLGAIFFWPTDAPALGALMLIPIAGTVLVLLFARAGTWTAWLLSFPGFVGIGLVSYSAYLWHQPLFAFARHFEGGEPHVAVMAGLVLLTFVLAWGTWHWVEQPFRRSAAPLLPRRRFLFVGAALAAASLFAIGAAGKTSDGFRDLGQLVWPERVSIFQVIETAQSAKPVQDDGACRFNIEAVKATLADRILDCRQLHGPGIAVLGDSHAIDVFGIAAAVPGHPFVVGFTKPACRPATTTTECPYASFDSFVSANPDVFSVTLFAISGAYLLTGEDGVPGVQDTIERLPPDAPVPKLELAIAEIAIVNKALSALSQKVPIVWVGPRIEPQVRLELLVRRGCASGLPIRAGTRENYERLNDHLAQESAVPYIDQNSLFRLEFPRDLGGCDGLFWKDGDHFSALGVAEMARRADVITAALALFP